jgi:DNA-binding PadR family transcriptional regulator
MHKSREILRSLVPETNSPSEGKTTEEIWQKYCETHEQKRRKVIYGVIFHSLEQMQEEKLIRSEYLTEETNDRVRRWYRPINS